VPESPILVVGGTQREFAQARAALGKARDLRFVLRVEAESAVNLSTAEAHARLDRGAPLADLFDAADVALGGRRPGAILCNAELDLVAAASLRGHYHLPGQDVASATAFRDKLVMKSRLARSGISVPRFADCRTAGDAQAAAVAWGGDVLLKPRDSFGARDIFRVGANAVVGDLPTILPGTYMAEEFIQGRLFHVDGVVYDHRCVFSWASEYLTAPLDFDHSRGGGSLILEPEDPNLTRLRAFAERCLQAMPTPSGTAFHMDVFETPDGRLLAGEIASRSAGNRIRGSHFAAFGVDLMQAAYRAQAGFPLRANLRATPAVMSGWGSLRMRPGLVERLPDLSWPPPGVLAARFHANVGERLSAARGAADSLLSFVLTGDTQRAVRARWSDALDWALARCDVAIMV